MNRIYLWDEQIICHDLTLKPSAQQSSLFSSRVPVALSHARRLSGFCSFPRSCSVSHLYKELSAHSSGHSDEPVWINGCRLQPQLMLLIHIRNVGNAEHLHTLEPRHKTPTLVHARSSDGPTIIQLLLSLSVTKLQLRPCSHCFFTAFRSTLCLCDEYLNIHLTDVLCFDTKQAQPLS